MNERFEPLRLLTFYAQISVRDKTTIEKLVCVVLWFLYRRSCVGIKQDVHSPISAWPTEIISGVLGMKQSGYTGSARVANDAQRVRMHGLDKSLMRDTRSL